MKCSKRMCPLNSIVDGKPNVADCDNKDCPYRTEDIDSQAIHKTEKQQLMNECDMLRGNVNRMMVTNDMRELNDMYEFACKRITTIYHENFDRLKTDEMDPKPAKNVVVCPTVLRAINEWGRVINKYAPIIKKANRQELSIELLGGTKIYFKGETEGQRALRGLHADIVTIDEFIRRTPDE